jgi:hypothetical protein
MNWKVTSVVTPNQNTLPHNPHESEQPLTTSFSSSVSTKEKRQTAPNANIDLLFSLSRTCDCCHCFLERNPPAVNALAAAKAFFATLSAPVHLLFASVNPLQTIKKPIKKRIDHVNLCCCG